MKSEIRPVNPGPEFEPVELVITIESEDELLELYHRHNLGWGKVKAGSNSTARRKPSHRDPDANHSVWDQLVTLCEERNIR